MLGAVVERGRGQRVQQRDQPVRRVVDEMRVGDMALHALDGQPAGHAAAPADLDHVAERSRPRSARRRRRRRSPRRAARSQSSTFLVPLTATPSSSPVINRLIEPAKSVAARRQKALGGGDKGGDRALHVDRAAAAQFAVAQRRGERLERPALGRPGRHDIGMAGKAQIGPAARRGGRRDWRSARSPRRWGRDRRRPAGGRRSRAAPSRRATMSSAPSSFGVTLGRRISSAASSTGSIGAALTRLAHSRSNSLIEVRARVCASTCLTMTAQ